MSVLLSLRLHCILFSLYNTYVLLFQLLNKQGGSADRNLFFSFHCMSLFLRAARSARHLTTPHQHASQFVCCSIEHILTSYHHWYPLIVSPFVLPTFENIRKIFLFECFEECDVDGME